MQASLAVEKEGKGREKKMEQMKSLPRRCRRQMCCVRCRHRLHVTSVTELTVTNWAVEVGTLIWQLI